MTQAFRRSFALGALVFAGVLAGAGALAPAGARAAERWSLDPSYGRGGVVVFPRRVAGQEFVPSSHAALDRWGGLVSGSQDTGAGLARATPSGHPDSRFGRGGVARLTPPGEAAPMWVTSLASSRTGGLLVGGRAVRGPVVARITSEGRPDVRFGARGFVRLPDGLFVSAIVERPGGALAVGVGDGHCAQAIYGLTRDGRRDRSFNSGRPAEAVSCDAFELAASGDGVFALGTELGPLPAPLDLAVFNRSGRLARLVRQIVGARLLLASGVYPAAGRVITVAGVYREVSGEPQCAGTLVAGYTPAGRADRTYAASGRALLAGCSALSAAQPGGKVLLADYPQPGGLQITRLTAHGRPDPAFGAGGTITVTKLSAAKFYPSRLIAAGSRALYLVGTDYIRTGTGTGSAAHLFAAKLIRTR